MKKKLILLDMICYVALPFLIWNYGRELLGDYPAMLISTIPGFIYTVYRFVVERQFNIAGLFIIGSLFINTTVNLLSGSAEQMLWNGVYLGLFYALIHFIVFIIKRPLALYFAVDFVYSQGWSRNESTPVFYMKGNFKWFQIIQILFIIRGLFIAGLKMWLLQKYGVEGYNQMLIYRQISEWLFGLLITAIFIYTNVPISKYFEQIRMEEARADSKVNKSLI
ncbi:VC0807 family protein [Paucisalibacillus sp. EB02]|uniref:VC0807 family protein n=1 Tax=Paucisalibacillus sp. EB02 TaxID=1347087 RepID=UPI0005A940C7|nr:VC0807 family protein [Paucisalibacillus sp. EB02]